MNHLSTLSEQLENNLQDQGRIWLSNAKSKLAELDDTLDAIADQYAILSATAKRHIGEALLNGEIASGFNQDAYQQCDRLFLDAWTATDAARVLLLAETISSKDISADQLFQLCYRYADGGERASLIKGLALIQLSSDSTDFVIDTARTNSLELFSALAHKNPWPAIFFPEAAFNQLVLKSLFMGFNLVNVEGLRAARNTELGRMTADYVQERLDAGREIPDSIWLAVDVACLSEQGLMALETALNSDSSQPMFELALTGCQWQTILPHRIDQVFRQLSH